MIKKHYTLDHLTVVWQPHLCIHSGVCFRSLPAVFKPRERPWVQLHPEDLEETAITVNACPSGALTLKLPDTEIIEMEKHKAGWHRVKVLRNGPLRIHEACLVTLSDGSEVEMPEGASLCRCGGSSNKPFCDGTHQVLGFRE